jgi:hypothetical protein
MRMARLSMVFSGLNFQCRDFTHQPIDRGLGSVFFLTNLDVGCLKEVDSIFIHAIGNAIDDAHDAGVDQGFCAVDAGEMSHVAGSAFGRNTMQGCLDDGIHFGVDGANTVPIYHQVTHFVTVGLPYRRAVKSGGQDALVAHQDTTDEGAVTGGTL